MPSRWIVTQVFSEPHAVNHFTRCGSYSVSQSKCFSQDLKNVISNWLRRDYTGKVTCWQFWTRWRLISYCLYWELFWCWAQTLKRWCISSLYANTSPLSDQAWDTTVLLKYAGRGKRGQLLANTLNASVQREGKPPLFNSRIVLNAYLNIHPLIFLWVKQQVRQDISFVLCFRKWIQSNKKIALKWAVQTRGKKGKGPFCRSKQGIWFLLSTSDRPSAHFT